MTPTEDTDTRCPECGRTPVEPTKARPPRTSGPRVTAMGDDTHQYVPETPTIYCRAHVPPGHFIVP